MESGLKLWGIMTASAIVLANDCPTLVKAAARLAKIVFRDRVQICDGTSDEDQINTTIAANGRVVLVGQTFTIDGSITKAVNKVVLEGQGPDVTTIQFAAATAASGIMIGGDGWQIKNLAIDGTNQTASNNQALIQTSPLPASGGKDDVLLENLCLHDASSRCVAISPSSDNVTIKQVKFADNDKGHIYVNAWEADVTNVVIDRCLFKSCGEFDMIGTYAEGVYRVKDIRVSNCRFDGDSGYMGVKFFLCEDATVSHSWFNVPNAAGAANSMCVRFHHVWRGGIDDCDIVGSEAGLVSMYDDAHHITISNSRLTGGGGPAIGVAGLEGTDSDNVTIVGNTFYNIGAETYALYLTDGCSDVIFADNIIEDDRGSNQSGGVCTAAGFTGSRLNIKNNIHNSPSYFAWIRSGGDDSKISDNIVNGPTIGICLDDGDDVTIEDNRLICTTPIDINNANVVRCVVQGNNWKGCTNDPSYGAATNPRFNYNIDMNGDWWSVSDAQPTTRHFMLTARGGAPSTTNPCAGPTKVEYPNNDVDIYHLDFDGVAQEFAQWGEIPLPDDYDGGTLIAVFYWTGVAGAGGVRWGLQGRAYADDDAIDQAWGTAQEVTDTFIAAGDVHISAETAVITLAGSPAAGQLVQFRAYRDPTHVGDTKAEDARLIAIKLKYTGK